MQNRKCQKIKNDADPSVLGPTMANMANEYIITQRLQLHDPCDYPKCDV